jgi:hypothetical protein
VTDALVGCKPVCCCLFVRMFVCFSMIVLFERMFVCFSMIVLFERMFVLLVSEFGFKEFGTVGKFVELERERERERQRPNKNSELGGAQCVGQCVVDPRMEHTAIVKVSAW